MDEFLQLEERLKNDEEYRTFVCCCTFLLVFLNIFKVCFQEREHVIFYICEVGTFFYFFTQGEGVIPRVERICSYNFDDLEDQVMIFVFFDKLNQLVAVICLTTMEPFL